MSVETTGFKEREAELRGFARILDRPVLDAFQRGAKRIAEQTRTDIASEGIGRSIWGKKPRGLTRVVQEIRPEKTGDELISGVRLKGIPAMIEEGGRIQTHKIKATPKRPIASKARGFFSKGPVTHPGMSLAARHYGEHALTRETPSIVEDMNREIGIALEKAVD